LAAFAPVLYSVIPLVSCKNLESKEENHMTQTDETVEGSLGILWENYGEASASPKYSLLFSRYKDFRNGAQRPKKIVGNSELEGYLINIHFTTNDAREWIKQVREKRSVRIDNTMMPAEFLPDYEP